MYIIHPCRLSSDYLVSPTCFIIEAAGLETVRLRLNHNAHLMHSNTCHRCCVLEWDCQ